MLVKTYSSLHKYQLGAVLFGNDQIVKFVLAVATNFN